MLLGLAGRLDLCGLGFERLHGDGVELGATLLGLAGRLDLCGLGFERLHGDRVELGAVLLGLEHCLRITREAGLAGRFGLV